MGLESRFEEGWWQKLSPFLLSQQFAHIGQTLRFQAESGISITPRFDDTFRAFKECPYKDLKVVFMGLDPYPNTGICDGLAFSSKYTPLSEPASLRYILDAMEQDVYGGFGIGFNEEYRNTDLGRWAKQGVLLINTALSTQVGKTGAHIDLWQPFISNLITTLGFYNTGLIYVFFGSQAKQWAAAVPKGQNYVFTVVHPAYCAYKKLKHWDCEHIFSKINKILEQNNKTKILW
jgi:uracil-DNA glycosylase